MGRRTFALLTGLFVMLLTTALVASALFLRGWHVTRSPYVVVADVPVTGLRAGGEVFFRGLSAGVVDSLRVDPDRPQRILVRILVDPDIPVTGTSFATLRSEGVTGSRRLQLDVGGPAPPLATSAEQPGLIPLHPSLLDGIEDQVRALLPKLQELVAGLNELTGPRNRLRVERILANTEAASAQLGGLERRLERSFGRAVGGVPGLVDQSRSTLARVDTLVAGLDRLAANLQALTDEATKLTSSTRVELSQNTLPRLRTALDQVTETGASLQRLSRQIQANPRALLVGPPREPPGPGERGHRWSRR